MALKAILAKLDEVDEKYRDLYTERNGKFEFTGVEGLKTQGDIDRILEGHRKTKTDLTTAQAALKAANDKLAVWEDMDPEDVKSKIEKLGTLEAGGSVPELAKNFETTVNARVAQVVDAKVKAETTKLQRQLDEAKTKLGETTAQVEGFIAQNNTRAVHDAVRAAAVAAKVLPEAVTDLLLVAGQDLKLVDGKVTTEDGRDPVAVIEDYKKTRPYFWPTAQGAGARGGNGGGDVGGDNPFSAKGWDMTKAGQLLKTDPARAQKLAEVAGVPKDASGNFQWHVRPSSEAK